MHSCQVGLSSGAVALSLFMACLVACCDSGYITLKNDAEVTTDLYEEPGDVNIAGLFPIHSTDENRKVCGKMRELGVLQRVEAMAHAIREINLNGSLIPGVKLGFYIADDCYKDTVTLAQGLHFVQTPNDCDNATSHTGSTVKPLDVVAVIGAESSTNSKQLAELLGLFHVPQVSYFSTSTDLSNKLKYPFFSRIVSSDAVQVKAIVSLMQSMHWQYFSFVYSLNDYGLSAYLQMLDLTGVTGVGQSSGLCIAAQRGISEDAADDEYSDTLDLLMFPPNGIKATVVVVYLNQMQAWKFLSVAQERELHDEFVWIGSDAWGRNSQDFNGIEYIAHGSLHVKLASHSDSKFDQYFLSRTPSLAMQNPWFEHFWMAHHACSNNCSTELHFSEATGYKEETTVSLVRDAVYLVAHGISRIQSECLNGGVNASCRGSAFRQRITGVNLQAKIRSFEGQVNIDRFKVNADGDGNRKYFFQSFQKVEGDYSLVRVGDFLQLISNSTASEEEYTFSLNKSALQWHPTTSLEPLSGLPVSRCSDECPYRHEKIRSLDYLHLCCWKCVACKALEYTYVDSHPSGLSGTTPTCQQCNSLFYDGFPIHQTPDSAVNYTRCTIIVPKSLSWSTPISWAIIVLTLLLLGATVVVLGLYIKFRDVKLIKATDSKLGYIIFSGAICSYLGTFAFLMRPLDGCDSYTDCCSPVPLTAVCYVEFVIFNIAFTVMYAPILTRINRIYRIFSAGLKSPMKPRFVESKYQVLITGLLVGVQVVIVGVACVVSACQGNMIRVDNIQVVADELKDSWVGCEIPYHIQAAPIVYNILLVVACAFHAVKTRKLPHNYNESKFIAFCVFAACVLWLAFMGAYFAMTTTYYKSLPLVAVMVLNATLSIGCLFVPRLYAVQYVRDSRERSLSAILTSSAGNSTPRNSIFMAAQGIFDQLTHRDSDNDVTTTTATSNSPNSEEEDPTASNEIASHTLPEVAACDYCESYNSNTVLARS